jgi:putative component of membrane protein insertase Oxa1/YidC/SpoIIIJ protein YidD
MRNFIILFFLASSFYASGQTSDELAVLSMNTKLHEHQTSWSVAKNNNSTMEIVLSSMFKFYKYFISSQDSQSCSFSPSCSVYAVETIKKQGFFLGILDTFDRLSRCNGMSPEKYEINQNHTLLIDPVHNAKYHEL